MFKKISLGRTRSKFRIEPHVSVLYELRTTPYDHLTRPYVTVVFNCMDLVITVFKSVGLKEHGRHTVECKVVRCSYGAHTVLIRLYEIQ